MIQLDFDPAMLRHDEGAGERLAELGDLDAEGGRQARDAGERASAHARAKEAASTARIGVWRTEMDAGDRHEFEAVAGSAASRARLRRAILTGRPWPTTTRSDSSRRRRVRRASEPEFPAPFVVGVGRSGTTLLRMMLDSHPEIAIPPETHFIPQFIQASGKLRYQPGDADECDRPRPAPALERLRDRRKRPPRGDAGRRPAEHDRRTARLLFAVRRKARQAPLGRQDAGLRPQDEEDPEHASRGALTST